MPHLSQTPVRAKPKSKDLINHSNKLFGSTPLNRSRIDILFVLTKGKHKQNVMSKQIGTPTTVIRKCTKPQPPPMAVLLSQTQLCLVS
jgi:hypothetical protein